MNNYFGRHAIVTIEPSGSFITLKTYDAQHGNSTRMYIESDKLYRWIDSKAQSMFLDHAAHDREAAAIMVEKSVLRFAVNPAV